MGVRLPAPPYRKQGVRSTEVGGEKSNMQSMGDGGYGGIGDVFLFYRNGLSNNDSTYLI
ncbi:MAG: hypothetical protein Q7V12_01155 [Deltaproteobacteria bacterium]|nr:hypothetical protein [Deltaproteobacteria bacterium]